MRRVALVHWNAAKAEERAGRLRKAGWRVELHSAQGGAGLRDFRLDPPRAFVIDLGRLPSHGRAVATFLRQQKGTRAVPIVFVDGEPEKVARVRALLPDATYADWPGIRGALSRAIREPPEEPVVPDTTVGDSKTPLPKKLGIREGSSVAALDAPKGFRGGLGTLPPGVRWREDAGERADLVLLFAGSKADLARRLPSAARATAEGGGLWILWPKKASGVGSDLSQAAVREFGLRRGFVDHKVCAVDETWSGLRFARRRRDPGERPGPRGA